MDVWQQARSTMASFTAPCKFPQHIRGHDTTPPMALTRPTRIALYGLGVLGSGVLVYVGLLSTGLLESGRAAGGGFILDTLTTTSTKGDFVRMVMSAAARVMPSLSLRSRALLAAWAAHESGWGKGTKQAKVFNIWNLTAGGAWLSAGKPVMGGNDTEFSAGSSTAKKITQQWRMYGSMDESVADLLQFLSKSGYVNYREAYAQLVAGDENFVTTLGVFERGADGVVMRVENRANTAGFYTLPRSEYQRSTSKLSTEVSALVATNQLASGIS